MLVEKWGHEVLVGEEILAHMGKEGLRVFLVNCAIAKAASQGWAHLPGGDHVEYVHGDDPRVLIEGAIPEGAAVARVSIRCYRPSTENGSQ